ncbi:MAG TPA: ABC transporter permease, partial [Spirochaetota bacterium]|nr:ABC transporter permease [Spirochaetota bacterium]
LGFVGSVLGALIGGVLVKIFTYFPFNFEKMTGGYNWASNTIYFLFTWFAIFKALFFGIVVSAVCSFLASLKAAFVEPIEALRR